MTYCRSCVTLHYITLQKRNVWLVIGWSLARPALLVIGLRAKDDTDPTVCLLAERELWYNCKMMHVQHRRLGFDRQVRNRQEQAWEAGVPGLCGIQNVWLLQELQ